jgi:hypothetical protein
MPNRYEREIEEILRNLEQTEPRSSLGQKLSGRMRRKSDYSAHTRRRGLPFLNLSASVWFLAIAVAAALIAGGLAYAQGEATIVTGTVAVVGALCLLLVVLSPFFSVSHHTQATRYGNVTPLRPNPLQGLVARWNLLLLRLRYRRRQK